MADKLDWLNQHFVLLTHKDVNDVVLKENYKIPFELRDLAKNCPVSEDFIKKLAVDTQIKQAVEFLSYNLHHRALAWWAYCLVLSIRKEQLLNPEKPVDIADIGKPKPFDIPDWAKMPPENEISPETQKQIDEIKKDIEELNKLTELGMSKISPEDLKLHQEVQDIVYGEFKKIYGGTPQDLLQDAIKKVNEYTAVPDIDEVNSPIFKAANDLETKIETIRVETVKTIKQALNTKSDAELKEQVDSALEASFSYVVAPTDENAKRCMDVGNLCPDTPEGMLALVCFWSYGNLMPGSKQVVRTPNGLAANGFNSLCLMCCLAKGGTRKFEERVQHYFNIGKEVAFGLNNWSKHVIDDKKEVPLEHQFSGIEKDAVSDNQKTTADNSTTVNNEFKRFKGF